MSTVWDSTSLKRKASSGFVRFFKFQVYLYSAFNDIVAKQPYRKLKILNVLILSLIYLSMVLDSS